MATPEERKLELERKKQRLAEIRDEKKRREDDKRQQLLQHQQAKAGDAAPKLPLVAPSISSLISAVPERVHPGIGDGVVAGVSKSPLVRRFCAGAAKENPRRAEPTITEKIDFIGLLEGTPAIYRKGRMPRVYQIHGNL